jgi:hypothetical protein
MMMRGRVTKMRKSQKPKEERFHPHQGAKKRILQIRPNVDRASARPDRRTFMKD